MTNLALSLSMSDAPSMVQRAKAAEAAGFNALWTSEMVHDPFLPLAAVASATQRVDLGSAIALAFVRSPWVTALSALDMDMLSDGRFILGLGTGLKRLNERWHGVAYGRPTPHIKECIEAVRLIIECAHRGQPIRFAGHYYDIDIQGWQRPYRPLRDRIPIYLAGVREGMIRTAAEVADGLLGHPIYSLSWIKSVVLPSLERGLRASGRRRADLHVCLAVCCAVDNDARQARRAAAATIAFYATINTYEPLFQALGFERQVRSIHSALGRGDTTAMIDAVSEEMVDAFAVAGNPDEARRKLTAYDGLADSLCLTPPDQLISLEASDSYWQAILDTFGR